MLPYLVEGYGFLYKYMYVYVCNFSVIFFYITRFGSEWQKAEDKIIFKSWRENFGRSYPLGESIRALSFISWPLYL